MWTEAQLTDGLMALGLREGDAVLVHSSLRSVGKMDGGADALLSALRRVLGDSGSLMTPTFTYGHIDPANWRDSPSPEMLAAVRAEIRPFVPGADESCALSNGVFSELVRRQKDARRSCHPVVSFAAIGAHADFLTRDVPLHYPLGSDSPLARLHQIDGRVLLVGVDHSVNSSLHLAEVWAELPYIHRSILVKTGSEDWTQMRGSPECSDGFRRIETVLRQARILRTGNIGSAPAQIMRSRHLISMAITVLRGDPAALLCGAPTCPYCSVARKLIAPSEPLRGPAERET